MWNIFRFIDDLIAKNDGNKFENHYNEIDPSELIWKKEHTSNAGNNFPYLYLYIDEVQIQTSFYDKMNYSFNVIRSLCKGSTIP